MNHEIVGHIGGMPVIVNDELDPDEIAFATFQPWDIEEGVTCVVCPGCAFTFDRDHTDDTDEGGYTCPVCGCGDIETP